MGTEINAQRGKSVEYVNSVKKFSFFFVELCIDIINNHILINF